MREIGGYIEFEKNYGKEYHNNALALNSAKAGLMYLIRSRKIKKIYVPYFLCSPTMDICVKEGIEFEHYRVDINLRPDFEKPLDKDEYIYIVNYYGQLSNEEILNFKAKYGNIIIDNVQAFFQMPANDVDTIYTCRKFFGVPDGAYLYSDCDALKDDLDEDFSYDRMTHLLGRFEKTASDFYNMYVQDELKFREAPLKKMSKLTHNLLRGIDYDRVKAVRTENCQYLHSRFEDINKLKFTVPEGSFMYPLYINNGGKVRKELLQYKIYIPTLWPDVFKVCSENDLEYDLAVNILPIPVDQRYNSEDMQYLAEKITNMLEKRYD